MRKIIILSLFYLPCLFSSDSLEKYFSYVEQLAQSNGNCREGEIEVILDPVEIFRIQKIQENRLLKKGLSEQDAKDFSRIGIVSEDQYVIWLRDAVCFPKGEPGTYDRLIWKNSLKNKAPGVAVLPILPSGRIILNLNYRHATRSWEFELPRGVIQPNENWEEAAKREVKEETGYVVSSITFLGKVTPDTGMLSSVIPVYLGKISAHDVASPEDSEAIAEVISFTKDELIEGVIQGFLEVSIQGKKERVLLRDAFLAFALLQAEFRKLL